MPSKYFNINNKHYPQVDQRDPHIQIQPPKKTQIRFFTNRYTRRSPIRSLNLTANMRHFLHIDILSFDHVHTREAKMSSENKHEKEQNSRKHVGCHVDIVNSLIAVIAAVIVVVVLVLETARRHAFGIRLSEAIQNGKLPGMLNLLGRTNR